MKRSFPLPFPWALLALLSLEHTGCGGPGPAKPPLPPIPTTVFPHIVGYNKALVGPCPDPLASSGGQWTGNKVFEAPDGTLPKEMASLCSYDWSPNAQGAPPDPKGIPWLKLGNVVANASVVAALDSSIAAVRTRLDPLRKSFFEQVEWVASPAEVAPGARVTIAFIDSSPRSLRSISLNERNPHGFNVAWIAQSIACPSRAACAAEPSMHQAMTGSSGTRGALATAIHDAVTSFLTARRSPDSTRHLIVNLSLGWESAFDCKQGNPPPDSLDPSKATLPHAPNFCPAGSFASSPAAADAVYHALLYASCAGAVNIAAAGNDMGYTPPLEGPMLPAAWEFAPRPSATACAEWFPHLPASVPLGEGIYAPLVHAVDGIGKNNLPLPVSRKDNRPRLAAPASLATGFQPSSRGETGPLAGWYAMTGTSAAAAATSGIAASVWSLQPKLHGSEVMALLFQTGEELYRNPVDFCTGSRSSDRCGAMKSRRVSHCRALREACRDRCPELTCAMRAAYKAAHATAGRSTPPLERPTTIRFPSASPSIVYGQPGNPLCPECSLKLSYDPSGGNPEWFLKGTIDSGYFHENGVETATGMMLQLFSEAGERIATIPASGTSATIEHDRYSPGSSSDVGGKGRDPEPATATLTWTQHFEDGSTSLLTQEIPISR